MTLNLFDGLDILLDSKPEAPTSGIYRNVMLTPHALTSAARRMFEADYHLEDISGLDAAEGYLVTYHFDRFDNRNSTGRIAVRVLVPHKEACLPSIAAVFNGAEWHEREIMDFFGVTFEDNPNPAALLLPELDDSTPLRKAADKRRRLRELIQPGTIIFKAASFDVFDDEAPAPVAETNQGSCEQPDCP